MTSSDQPRFRWYHFTPGFLILVLLAAECFLFVSGQYAWFALSEYKGWTALAATALAVAAILLLAVWFGTLSLRRYQFSGSVRAIFISVVAAAAAIAAVMFVGQLRIAARQRRAVRIIRQAGSVGYNNRDKNFLDDGRLPGVESMIDLLGDDFFMRVDSVSLNATRITPATLDQLDQLPHIRKLQVGGPRLSATVLQHIEALQQLEELDLSGTNLSDTALESLASMKQLTALELDGTDVTDAGLRSLVGLTRLQRLALRGNFVTDAGLTYLKNITTLTHVDLSRTEVTDVGIAKLKLALPKCIVAH